MKEFFYIGYQPRASPAIRHSVRRAILALALISLLVVAVLALAQSPFAASAFALGQYRDYEGELIAWPYPMLLSGNTRYLLVGPGKFGVAEIVRGHDGEQARLRGALISRGSDHMLEIDPASFHLQPSVGNSRQPSIDLGPITLTCEIVDTKCHLGVMNPGEGKLHRECAVRCLSGGAPVGFLVRDATGSTRLLLLLGSDGRSLGQEILDWVAEPITVPGQLSRQGPSLILQAEPRKFSRRE